MHQYIDHVVCFNTTDSHHRLNEYTILYIFRAPRHDSLVPLNWYKYIPLINNLETEFFKNKNKEEGVDITNLINRIVQVLREDLYWIKISIQDAGLIKLIKL